MRRSTASLSSGLVMASGIFLLNSGALIAAPTPIPKPTPVPVATPTVAPIPTATPAATIASTPVPRTATYSGPQQMQYLSTANDAFVALRQAKAQAVIDATKVFDDAGSINPKGLTSKAAISARRDLLAKCMAANADYISFVQTQADTYRAELAKTPLIPADIDSVVAEFNNRANTAGVIKLRETERDTLKCDDDMLAFLAKLSGNYTVDGAGRLGLKKKSDVATYNALSHKHNDLAAQQVTLRAAVNGTNTAPTASVPPTASPAASVAPTATPAAAASPAAKAGPTASASPAH